VCLVIRAGDIRKEMSSYLVDRLISDPRVTVHTSTEVGELHGDEVLASVTLANSATGTSTQQSCSGLFCFIGATPATQWLTAGATVASDENGFLFTDVQLADSDIGTSSYAALGRDPLPFETSVPGLFAAGDVRHGSMKRVAAAVGEGASAVASVHRAIGAHL
jgi:thioredoxin reductase (NADPH)